MKTLITTLLAIASSFSIGGATLIGKFKIEPTGSHANGRLLKSGYVQIYHVRTQAEAQDGYWVNAVKDGAFRPHLFLRVIGEYAVPLSATDPYYRTILLPYDSPPLKDQLGDLSSSSSGGDFEFFHRADGEVEASRERLHRASFELTKREGQFTLRYGGESQSFRYLSHNVYELEGSRTIDAMGLVLSAQ